jgi:hypothetical protein
MFKDQGHGACVRSIFMFSAVAVPMLISKFASGADGVYGTTSYGGSANVGTIFKIVP